MRTETQKLVNRHQPDPITNRKMTDKCWDGDHHPRCAGWFEACERCQKDRRHDKETFKCSCECHLRRCECACHDDNPLPKRRVKVDKNLTMDILDSGCGTIEVK